MQPNYTPNLSLITGGYVKNPNYNPNDPNSLRYVDNNTAAAEAAKRASTVNSFFNLTGDKSRLVQPANYFTPSINALTANATPAPMAPQPQPQIQPAPVPQPQSPTSFTYSPTTPVTGENNANNNANLATLAARAGLSLNEYQQLVQNQGLATGDQITKIREDLGIPGLIKDAYSKPKQSSVEAYKSLYKELGLNTIKDRIAEVDTRLQSRRDDLVKATGEIKNNPWLSQGSRTGRMRVLNELASADIANILDERQQYLDLYDQGISEIETQVGYMITDQADARSLTADKLNFMLTEAERRQSVLERDNTTEGLRNVPEFLQAARNETLRLEANKAAGSGGNSYSGGVDGLNISDQAKNIIKQINLGASMDDLIKGSSISAQNLRNEVLAGLNAQGGLGDNAVAVVADAKNAVDQMLSTGAYKALGGYSTVLGGQFTTAYGDAKAAAQQLIAILSRDNMGLIKGAMSDKDLEFLTSMSAGFEGEGIQSEAFIKRRLEEIQQKVTAKYNLVSGGGTGQAAGTAQATDADKNYVNSLQINK